VSLLVGERHQIELLLPAAVALHVAPLDRRE
jgi:hypothetical protein